MNYSLESISYTSYASKVNNISYNHGTEGIVASFKNNSGKKLNGANAICLMYDSQGKLIEVGELYLECNNPGSEYYCTFDYPYDEDYNPIIPSTVKIYIRDAYLSNY